MKKHLLFFAVAVICLGVSSCKTDEIFGRIDDLQSQIDALSSEKIATIDKQIKSINATIEQLGATDAALKSLIENLSTSQNALAEELKAKDAAIEAKIAELKAYVDQTQSGAKDWATTTFATIAQFNSLSDEVAALKAAFATASEDVKKLGADLTKQIEDVQASITSLETSMKSWVNEQLAKYYTIAEIDAKIALIESSMTDMSEAEAADIKAVRDELEAAKKQITEAYTEAIAKAINENNGVIDSKIASEIATVNANIDNKIAEVSAKIAELEKRVSDLEDKVSDLTRDFDIVFDENADLALSTTYYTTVNYKIVGATENTIVRTFIEGDINIIEQSFGKVEDEFVGHITVNPKSFGTAGTVFFLVGDNDKTILRSIDFEKGAFSLTTNAVEFPCEGGSMTIDLETNVNGDIYNMYDWLTVAVEPKTKSMRTDVITITAQANEVENVWRYADIYVLGLSTISVVQQAPLTKIEVTEPGTLSSVYPLDLAYSVTGVAFSGEFNDADWTYLKSYFTSLKIADFSALKNTTIPENQFSSNSVIKEIKLPEGLVEVPSYFAYGATSIQKVNIPESVKVIGDFAFRNCSQLSEVPLPEGLETIGNYAFANCSSLKTVALPKGLTTIGRNVFFSSNNIEKFSGKYATEDGSAFIFENRLIKVAPVGLKSYIVPTDVTSIDEYCFSYCPELNEVTLSEGLQSIGNYAFYFCSALKSISIPSSVISIGSKCFAYCTELIEVILPEGLQTIRDYTFQSCTTLKSISIPSSVTSIGSYCFDNCTDLTEVILPEGLTTIGNYAFNYCKALKSITIPSSVTSIGSRCFMSSAISTLTCLATTPPTFGSNIFKGCSLSAIYVPAESVSAYQIASGWSTYQSMITAIPTE